MFSVVGGSEKSSEFIESLYFFIPLLIEGLESWLIVKDKPSDRVCPFWMKHPSVHQPMLEAGLGMPVQASCKVFLVPLAAKTGLFQEVWGGALGWGMHITNQLSFLQHKWELARASLLASGMGPTQLPKFSSMYQALVFLIQETGNIIPLIAYRSELSLSHDIYWVSSRFCRKLAVFDTWSALAVHIAMDNTVVMEDISK